MTAQQYAEKRAQYHAANYKTITFKGYTFDYTKAVFQGSREEMLCLQNDLAGDCCTIDSLFASHWDHSKVEPVEMWTMWI
jgi:hypothetical protein